MLQGRDRGVGRGCGGSYVTACYAALQGETPTAGRVREGERVDVTRVPEGGV